MYGSPPPAAPPRDLNRPFPLPPQSQMSSGLLRYRSAPSTLLGEVCEDFLPIRATSPETETMFARFLNPESPRAASAASEAGGGVGGVQRSAGFPLPPTSSAVTTTTTAIAAERTNNSGSHGSLGFSSAMVYQHQNPAQMVGSSMAVDADQIKNNSNLIRQSSSPAGLFSHLNVENGYGAMRGINGGGGVGRLKSQLSFSSSRQSSLLSQISEIENESVGGYPMNSWEESQLLSPSNYSPVGKRPRESSMENGELRNGLSHQFSMPKTTSEMAAIEKFLQFQDSVPCKIRAKRGCATHPRSIAERVRRTRISERMRKLQELVPNMDKQTNTADMLDLAVDYIKDLQKQVMNLTDSRASCTCSSSKQKLYTNSTM